MGMYTELCIGVALRPNMPLELIAALKFLAGGGDEPAPLPDHRFFQCSRWRSLMSMDSYYFPADSTSAFRYDDIGENYILTFRSNMKNYDNEQEKFLHLIDPWLEGEDTPEFVGFQRYEESEDPTLIYINDDGKLEMRAIAAAKTEGS